MLPWSEIPLPRKSLESVRLSLHGGGPAVPAVHVGPPFVVVEVVVSPHMSRTRFLLSNLFEKL